MNGEKMFYWWGNRTKLEWTLKSCPSVPKSIPNTISKNESGYLG